MKVSSEVIVSARERFDKWVDSLPRTDLDVGREDILAAQGRLLKKLEGDKDDLSREGVIGPPEGTVFVRDAEGYGHLVPIPISRKGKDS